MPGPDDDGLGLGPQPVRVGARFVAGDPLRAAVGGRGATVEAHRGLEQRERATGRALVQVRARATAATASAPTPTVDLDAGGAQPLDAGAAHPWVGIFEATITVRPRPRR